MVRAGLLKKIEIHKVYVLSVNGMKICKYEADFVLHYPDGRVVVVDVKSAGTEGLRVFLIKKALMLAILGIEIQIYK